MPEWKYFLTKLSETPTYAKLLLLEKIAPFLNPNNAMLESLLLQNYIDAGSIKTQEQRISKLLSDFSTLRLIRPIYKKLMETSDGRILAFDIYEKSKNSYSYTTRTSIRNILFPHLN